MSNNGSAFTSTPDKPETADVTGFDLRAWIRGATPVTRSVTVYGRPDLMGQIEALKEQLVAVQSAPFDDDRPLVKTEAMRIAEEIERLRDEMKDSALRFRFRGMKNGELEDIKKEMGREDDAPDGIGELDYRCMERQCVEPAGLSWEDFRELHTNLGNYFNQTIIRTCNAAARGGEVDVPFSSASSALTGTSSKS
ncbi:hypothetical protein [Phycicoccus avicenniae]|uniref:hypothetical protein n=1 Tax=Phycicoccus avicenniae TaxID=2828860 RepID=UPI003D2CA0CC